VFTAPLHSNGSYSIFACLFVAAGMCLPSRCLAMSVYSNIILLDFGRHITLEFVPTYIVVGKESHCVLRHMKQHPQNEVERVHSGLTPFSAQLDVRLTRLAACLMLVPYLSCIPPWRWKKYLPPKRHPTSIELHSVTLGKEVFISLMCWFQICTYIFPSHHSFCVEFWNKISSFLKFVFYALNAS
jgi:hypothetical protein